MSKQLIHTVLIRLVDWFTRQRSSGIPLLKAGLFLVAVAFGSDYALQLNHVTEQGGVSLSFGTGQGVPAWFSLGVAGIGLILIIISAFILLAEFRRESRRRLVVIEMRGLNTSPDTPALDKVVPSFRGNRRNLPIDFRPQRQDARVDPSYMLERMSSMKSVLQSLVDGADKRDIEVAIGGLASVPALFLAGMLIDDESHVHLYDWDRNLKSWRSIDGPDDSLRFLPLEGLPAKLASTEVVMVVEASYSVYQADIAASFAGSLPVIRLKVQTPLADRFWSEQKQVALTTQFRDAIQQISATGVKKIHMVIAAPASLSIRFGMSYDRRLFPEIIVYQFEKGLPKPYPWGVEMPTVGTAISVIHT